LPNVGPYIYDVNISGFTRSSIYIYDISSLRVKHSNDTTSLIMTVLNDMVLISCNVTEGNGEIIDSEGEAAN